MTDQNNAGFLEYRFRKNRYVTNLVLGVEASETLTPGSWSAPGSLTTESIGTDSLTGDSLYRATLPIGAGQRAFLRLKASIGN